MGWAWLRGTLVVVLMGFGGLTMVKAAENSGAVPVWDGVSAFDKMMVRNALEGSVQESAQAGGVRRRSVFLHPLNKEDATVTYRVKLPNLEKDDRLVFACYIGLRDGLHLDEPEHPVDGVGFAAEVDGQRVFHELVKETRWVPVAADLARWAGKEVELRLVTDAGGTGNTNYDWALFGEPQIVLLRGNTLDARSQGQGTTGVVLLDHGEVEEGAELSVLATDATGAEVGGSRATIPLRKTGLALLESDHSKLPQAAGFRVETKAVKVEALRACVYCGALVVTGLGTVNGVCFAGQPIALVAKVKNVGKGALVPEDKARVEIAGGKSIEVERLEPGAEKTVLWEIPAGDKGELPIRVSTRWGGTAPRVAPEGTGKVRVVEAYAISSAEKTVKVEEPLPRLPAEASAQPKCRRVGNVILLENSALRLAFMDEGAGPMLVYARTKAGWSLVATSPALCELILEGQKEPAKLQESKGGLSPREVEFSQTFEGLIGEPKIRFALTAASHRVSVTTSFTARQTCRLAALRGPAILVGDNATGEAKRMALFPGLEYLEANEQSSSTRDLAPPLNNRLVPDPYKVTIPLMAVETEKALVALLWDQNQKWDGAHSLVSACFASPNSLDSQANHRLQLFLPAGRDFLGENELVARTPVEVAAGKTLTLRQELLVAPGAPVLDAVNEWCAMAGGVPKAQNPPRNFDAEMALCRTGFLRSVWDEKTQKSRHCVGWSPANAPGFATLLLYDARTAKDAEGARQARERADFIARQTLKEQSEGGLTSGACCHIMRWELPFHWGHLAGALKGMRDQALGALGSMDDDGGWRFYPDESRKALGEPGSVELGTCAGNALAMLRYARLTGDETTMEAGLKALKFIDEHFKVPRGAQGWECPIHEPDILASAHAIGALVEAYRLTENRHYLDRGRYWAMTGVPFHYLWDDPTKPGMRYASIPVFGSTFFTHSWLGLPVQWCGLVYAYHLQHLAGYDNSFPWKEVARGITVSGMYQQFAEGEDPELTGCYPDSWGNYFTRKNGAFINPEDLAVNVLALEGHDPEPSTAILRNGKDRFHVSSGAQLSAASLRNGALRFEARYFPGELSYTLISGLAEPASVTVDGKPATKGHRLEDEGTDCVYSPDLAMLFLKLVHGTGPTRVEVTGVKRGKRQEPEMRTAWNFKSGVEGWGQANSCVLANEKGALTVTVTGRDPYFFSGEFQAAAGKFPRVVVRARTTAGNGLGLFWRTDRSPGWGEDKHVTVAVTPGNEYRDIIFDLSSHPLWKGAITQIRLDLEPEDVGMGARLEIENVAFGAAPRP